MNIWKVGSSKWNSFPSRRGQEIFLTEVVGLGIVEPNVEEDMTWNFDESDMPRAHQSELVGFEEASRINEILGEAQVMLL